MVKEEKLDNPSDCRPQNQEFIVRNVLTAWDVASVAGCVILETGGAWAIIHSPFQPRTIQPICWPTIGYTGSCLNESNAANPSQFVRESICKSSKKLGRQKQALWSVTLFGRTLRRPDCKPGMSVFLFPRQVAPVSWSSSVVISELRQRQVTAGQRRPLSTAPMRFAP